MTDDALSQVEISALVDVANMSGRNLNPAQRLSLDRLIAGGLIEQVEPQDRAVAKYAVTPKGQRALDERGVGANES